MARLNGLIIGGERKVFLDAALALGFGIAEPLEKLFSVSDLKIPFGKLALVFEEYIAIGHALIVEGEIIDVVDPLNIHGEPLKSRSEEHTSELQSLMRISYAVLCLQKKIKRIQSHDE